MADDDIRPGDVTVAELRTRLLLDGFDLGRLEFERWRVANGHDPEFMGMPQMAPLEPCRSPLFPRRHLEAA